MYCVGRHCATAHSVNNTVCHAVPRVLTTHLLVVTALGAALDCHCYHRIRAVALLLTMIIGGLLISAADICLYPIAYLVDDNYSVIHRCGGKGGVLFFACVVESSACSTSLVLGGEEAAMCVITHWTRERLVI